MNSLIIGLTGPSGAGKSTVAAAFEKAGCKIIDADRIARETVANPDCIAALKAEYGSDIVFEDGSLNRHLLASRAFSNPQSTQRLNEITHPVILNEIVRRIAFFQQNGVETIVLDAPLLFESGADSLCTVTVAVTAPENIRLNRIMNRDAISIELAKTRIGAQHTDEYYCKRANYFFDGSGEPKDVELKTRQLLQKIMGDMNESTAE